MISFIRMSNWKKYSYFTLRIKYIFAIFQFKYRQDKDSHWLSGAPCHPDLPLATDQVQFIMNKLRKNMDYQTIELLPRIQLDKVENEIKTLICSPFIIVIIAVRLFVQSLESSTRRPAWWVLTTSVRFFLIFNIFNI